MFDTPHNHKCDDCGVIWHHDPKAIPDDDRAHTVAHSCPACGTQQYEKLGTGKPQYCSNGVRCIKLDGSGEICSPAPTKPLSPAQRADIEHRRSFYSFLDSLMGSLEQGQGLSR